MAKKVDVIVRLREINMDLAGVENELAVFPAALMAVKIAQDALMKAGIAVSHGRKSLPCSAKCAGGKHVRGCPFKRQSIAA